MPQRRAGGKSVQLPCATSAAMPMLSPNVGWGWMVFADVHRVGPHLDGQGHLADHVARVGADDAAPPKILP